MTERPCAVLFLCTGNAARSILAEALLNHLGGARFRAYSAGAVPAGRVHPRALALLAARGVPVAGLRSKSWSELATPEAPRMDLIITVCDAAAGEACPVWPGHPATAHWGMPDPAAATGDAAAQDRAFQDAVATLEGRLRALVALPVAALDRPALAQRVAAIGAAGAAP